MKKYFEDLDKSSSVSLIFILGQKNNEKHNQPKDNVSKKKS